MMILCQQLAARPAQRTISAVLRDHAIDPGERKDSSFLATFKENVGVRAIAVIPRAELIYLARCLLRIACLSAIRDPGNQFRESRACTSHSENVRSLVLTSRRILRRSFVHTYTHIYTHARARARVSSTYIFE